LTDRRRAGTNPAQNPCGYRWFGTGCAGGGTNGVCPFCCTTGDGRTACIQGKVVYNQ
jgi:hypothetical protein